MEALSKKSAQKKMDRFYHIDNLVRIDIVMDPDVWREKVLEARPRLVPPYPSDPLPLHPPENGDQPEGNYDWVTATSVTISGSKFPKKPMTFTNVGVKKKSYLGSLSYRKPSLKLNFAKFNAENKKTLQKLIGTQHVMLNNSKQDSTYLRQPLGYEIIKQAGLPALRCNFATVTVNGQFWGGDPTEAEHKPPGDPRILLPHCPPRDGVYVNVENVTKKAFYDCQFHNKKGNVYKIFEQIADFTPTDIANGYWPMSGFSPYKDRKDLMLAAQEIQTHGLDGAKRVLDWKAYIRFLSLELITANVDGFNYERNNTMLYNDVKAKADPTLKDLNFKFIPMGIDTMFQVVPAIKPRIPLVHAMFAQMVLKDEAERVVLHRQMRRDADKIFGPKNLNKTVWPYVRKIANILQSAGAFVDEAAFMEVTYQISNYQRWAYEATTESEEVLEKQAGCCSMLSM